MSEILGLIGFAAVSSVTPGPNNLLLWASGATFGFRRTIPHILGTAIGLGGMALAVAAGLGALVSAVPELALAMKVGGSFYLLFLAYQVAGMRALHVTSVPRPLGIGQAAAFQVINPKAWIFALGAMTTFRPTALPTEVGAVAVALTMMAVILPTAGLWAAGGGIISRLLVTERRQRIVGAILAIVLVATVAAVWI